MEYYKCLDCGYEIDRGQFKGKAHVCPCCKGRFYLATRGEESITLPKSYKLSFTGSAGEYFRIWIVNTFLSIITLGIYAAWAKVRNRQYFYAHTVMDDQSFDYLANPIAILKGNIVIGIGLLLYFLTQAYDPYYHLGLILVAWLVFPFLIYKSLRFFAYNSAYRNIRFRFRGTLKESYKTYFLIPLCIPFTLGILFPYWACSRKIYFFDNFSFGSMNNSFNGTPRSFYEVFGMAVFMSLGAFFAMIIGMLMMYETAKSLFAFNAESPNQAMFLIPICSYAILLVFSTLIQQYVYARITNYCWRQSNLGTIQFKSTLQPKQLFKIRFTNILAIIFSAGLLIPWAKVRRTRYIYDNMTIISRKDLSTITAAAEKDENALGDVATDFFDVEIGI